MLRLPDDAPNVVRAEVLQWLHLLTKYLECCSGMSSQFLWQRRCHCIASLIYDGEPLEASSYVEAFSFGRRGTPKMARVELERKFDAIEEKSEVKAQEIIEDDLTLDRTYFVSYVTFWERLSTTAANQKFDQLLEQQQRMYCEGGTEMVSYPDVRRRRRREGVETRSGVVERTGIDEAEYTVKRKRLYGKQSVSTTKPLEQSRAMVVVVRDAQVPTGDDAPEPSEHGLAGAAGRDEVKQATPNEKRGKGRWDSACHRDRACCPAPYKP